MESVNSGRYVGKNPYLHRQYLNYNPRMLANSGPATAKYANKLKAKQKELRSKENAVLANYASVYFGNAKDGDKVLELFSELIESTRRMKDSLLSELWRQKTEKTLDNDGLRLQLRNTLQNYLTDNFQKNNKTAAYHAKVNSLFQSGMDSLMINGNPDTSLGNAMEHLIAAALQEQFYDKLKQEKYTEKIRVAGRDAVINQSLGGRKRHEIKSYPDVVLTLGEVETKFPISIKTKTSGYRSEFLLLTDKNFEALLDSNISKSKKSYIREAVVNQTYWANSDYYGTVKEFWRGKVPGEIKATGKTRSDAIQTMDVESTIDLLKPAARAVRDAIIYSLLEGFDKELPSLFTMIIGTNTEILKHDKLRKLNTKSAFLRMSTIYSYLLAEALNSDGSAKETSKLVKLASKEMKDGSSSVVDGSLASRILENHSTAEWYRITKPVTEDILSRIHVRTSLNYGRLL